MYNVKSQVNALRTDTDAPETWKLQQLQQLLFQAEKARDANKQAIESLEASIRRNPQSASEKGEWLEANRHDFELHKAEIDLILEAIGDIRDQTIGKQLDLFQVVK